MFGKGFKREKGKKYGNIEVTYNGIKFDSKKEMQRYLVLKDAEKKGLIYSLTLQPKFELVPAVCEKYIKHLKTKDKECERVVQLAITYTADFAYYKGTEYVVEDVKASPLTTALDKAFLIKEKLFRWKFGYGIKRVYKPNEQV